jgi:hypothetical protein
VGQLAADLLPFGSKQARVSVDRISGVLRAAGLSASALAVPPSSEPAHKASDATTAASWGRTDSPAGSGKSAAVALVAVAVLGAGGYGWWRVGAVAADPERVPQVAAMPSGVEVRSIRTAPSPARVATTSKSPKARASAGATSSSSPAPQPATPVVQPSPTAKSEPTLRPTPAARQGTARAPIATKPKPRELAPAPAQNTPPTPKPTNPFADRK